MYFSIEIFSYWCCLKYNNSCNILLSILLQNLCIAHRDEEKKKYNYLNLNNDIISCILRANLVLIPILRMVLLTLLSKLSE